MLNTKLQNCTTVNKRAFLVFLLGFILLSYTFSQEPTNDSLLSFRLQAIQQVLQKDHAAVNTWWNLWLYGYSAATVGQSIVGITSNKLVLRQDMYLGAATTFIGAAGQFVCPVRPSTAYDIYAGMPENSREEKELKLKAAEHLLLQQALIERKGRSWTMHAASGAVNLSSGLITWFAFKRTWKDGLLCFAINTAITEAQIWSQPVVAKKYLYGISRDNSVNLTTGPGYRKVSYWICAIPGGVGLKVIF